MFVHLNPHLNATVELPTSKSISARALTINALAEMPCALKNLSDCDDTKAIAKALATRPKTVDIGAAGTAMRFLTAFFATRENEEHILTGTDRMKHRPIKILVDALRSLGAEISYESEEGFPPLRIKGRRLQGGEIAIPANVSSQYISALLMIGPTLEKGLTLHLEGEIASRPYILMTLGLMEEFGVSSTFENHTITVSPAAYQRTDDYTIEPDWSAASYWYELVALCPSGKSHVFLPNLKEKSVQGDSICAERFELLGVKTEFTDKWAKLKKIHNVERKALEMDFSDCPDLAQTFVVTAVLKKFPFVFTGLESLKIKETDRVAALISELSKLGYTVLEPMAGMLTYTPPPGLNEPKQSAVIQTYEDHRMAMCLAPAAYLVDNLEIEHPEVVSKSYPSFWDDIAGIR